MNLSGTCWITSITFPTRITFRMSFTLLFLHLLADRDTWERFASCIDIIHQFLRDDEPRVFNAFDNMHVERVKHAWINDGLYLCQNIGIVTWSCFWFGKAVRDFKNDFPIDLDLYLRAVNRSLHHHV